MSAKPKRYLNTALNIIYLYLLKGADGEGNCKVNSNWEIEDGYQSSFDDFIDEYNAEFSNDKDLQKMEIVKKGYPTDQNRRGIYVYTDSSDQSLIIDWADGKVYATIIIQIRIRSEQKGYEWKYQDALTDYLSQVELDTVGLIATTYSQNNQDSFNGATIRFDFVLDYLSDEDGLY